MFNPDHFFLKGEGVENMLSANSNASCDQFHYLQYLYVPEGIFP